MSSSPPIQVSPLASESEDGDQDLAGPAVKLYMEFEGLARCTRALDDRVTVECRSGFGVMWTAPWVFLWPTRIERDEEASGFK